MKALNLLATFLVMIMSTLALGQSGDKWVTSWAGSVQGPYPIGNPSAQPNLQSVFPEPAKGARDQSFRLIVQPSVWGNQARFRFSNALGTKPVTFDTVYVGLQLASAALVPQTNRPISFGGKSSVTVPPGDSVWSDAVAMPFARNVGAMAGRKLAVSFHVPGESGPMTWHAKGLQTSYVTAPGAGAKGGSESEADFTYTTASWYFLDALDMKMPAGTQAIVAFGDSITDGTASTMNGDDRWPNVLARRLAVEHPNKFAVINAGIGGNQVVGPADYSPTQPFPGGPSALSRLDRDVLSLSGVTAVIWLEGINDFSTNGNASLDAVENGIKDGVARIRAKILGVTLVGATLTSALHSTGAGHGSTEQNDKRKAYNQFIKTSSLFDATVDFDQVIGDPATGEMKTSFVPESTTGGPGEKLHPNRSGYLAMGMAFDLNVFTRQTTKNKP